MAIQVLNFHLYMAIMGHKNPDLYQIPLNIPGFYRHIVYLSGQIRTTSAEVTPNGGLV